MSASAIVAKAASSMSASAIVAKAASGSHVLKIDGYSRTTGLGVGNSSRQGRSKSEAVAGACDTTPTVTTQTTPALYPSCSALIPARPAKSEHCTRSACSIRKATQWHRSYVTESQTCITFTGKGELRGSYQFFISKAGLQNPLYLKDDAFSVKCDITVVTGVVTDGGRRGSRGRT
ncbi:hypothetical protein ACQ4PT_072257 [Festuca glaucescens]